MQYKVTIEETFTRTVIVEADTPYDAVEAAEELCNNSTIDLGAHDFSSRNCRCEGVADGNTEAFEKYTDPELAKLEDQAKEAINSFCLREYQEAATFEDLTKIPILWTDYEDELSELTYKVEVFANLKERSISTYVNEVLVSCVQEKTLADFVDTLDFLDFDAYAEISDEEWKVYWATVKSE